jgi:hypothetical protein
MEQGMGGPRSSFLIMKNLAAFPNILKAKYLQYTVKKRFAVFSSPAGMSQTKLSPEGNNLIILGKC